MTMRRERQHALAWARAHAHPADVASVRSMRLWTWINGSPVKLTLAPDQVLQWRSFAYTDEGFYAEQRTWQNSGHGDCISYVRETRQRDCDGLYEDGEELICDADTVNAGYADEDFPGVIYPSWERDDCFHRDHTAESMNY